MSRISRIIVNGETCSDLGYGTRVAVTLAPKKYYSRVGVHEELTTPIGM